MRGLVSKVASDPELARVYREQVVELRRDVLRLVIDRGIARGDLRPDTDVQIVHELLVSPSSIGCFSSRPPLNGKLGVSLVDAVLDGFTAR